MSYYYYYYYYNKFYLFSVFIMILKQTKFFWVYVVAAVLRLQYVVQVGLLLFPMMNVLYCNIRTFRNMCLVLFVVVFCSSLVSCFTGMWSGYFLINVELVPGTTVISGMGVSFFIFRIRCISVVSHFENLSGLSFNHVSVSWNNNIYLHAPFPLSRMRFPGLFCGTVVSVLTAR